jgi:hypothetical protein
VSRINKKEDQKEFGEVMIVSRTRSGEKLKK